MKIFAFIVAATLTFGAASVVTATASEKINSRESLRLCKNAMEADMPEGTKYKFKRNTATSVEPDRYKHWINFLEINGKAKNMKKLLCETSREGEILVMEIKEGRWKI